jgi:hypothetical protein
MESTIGQELMKMKRENGTYIVPLQKLSANSAQYQNNPELTQKVSVLLQKYPTFEEFAKANSPARQLYLCQEAEECILGNSPWLGLLDATYGRFASAMWLVPQIADVSVCCGLKEDASKDQIRLVASAIASRYKLLKTDEVMLFFFNFKAGLYERFYGYFDPQTVVRSVKSFCSERELILAAHERELQQRINEANAPIRHCIQS